MFSADEALNKDRTFYQNLYGGALLLITAVITFLFHHSNLQLARVGMKARIACSSLLYRKVRFRSFIRIFQY